MLNSKEFAIRVLERCRKRYECNDDGYEEHDKEGKLIDCHPPAAYVEVVYFKEKDLDLLEVLLRETLVLIQLP